MARCLEQYPRSAFFEIVMIGGMIACAKVLVVDGVREFFKANLRCWHDDDARPRRDAFDEEYERSRLARLIRQKYKRNAARLSAQCATQLSDRQTTACRTALHEQHEMRIFVFVFAYDAR